MEALIFCAAEPVTVEEMTRCLRAQTGRAVIHAEVEAAVVALQRRYADGEYAFELRALADGYQFLTKPTYRATVETLLQQNVRKRLSTAALETLAVVAYQQPITKVDIEQVRGVNCDYALRKLLDKELIEITGKADGPGRPLLYGTSRRFMEHFGLRSLKDLPLPREVGTDINTVGSPADT